MITYVNTVLVSNAATDAILTAAPAAATSINTPSADAGKFIFMNCDIDYVPAATPLPAGALYNIQGAKVIKIGLVTKQNVAKVDHATGTISYVPVVKWSNEIQKGSVKSFSKLTYTASTEDKVEVDFAGMTANVENKLKEGGKRVIVRITYKDMPTRFRKWTDSYEYVTVNGDTKKAIATAIAKLINKQYKRARVSVADDTNGKLTFTALPYTDDNTAESINVAGKVRFNVNVYFTDPTAAAFASNNKYFVDGVTIKKTPGVLYPADAKLVRDHERQAMGYQGVLNRGEGTWPIIKPAMDVDMTANYDALTLQLENTYHAADDINRQTKEVVEIYGITGKLGKVEAEIKKFLA